MADPIHELTGMYLKWLTSQVWINYRHNSPTKYDDLMQMLWEKPFVWTVAKDDNRVEDALEQRYLFLTDEELRIDFNLMHKKFGDSGMLHSVADFRKQECRVLEVIVALAKRLCFAEGSDTGWWAWRLIVNLDLHKMRDPITPAKRRRVDDILDTLIWRTYERDGSGGFFPLAYPQSDQRKVEIWYQMSAYLAEFGNP